MIIILIAIQIAGYPIGDARCTIQYQRATHFEFWADDFPNCPSFKRVKR